MDRLVTETVASVTWPGWWVVYLECGHGFPTPMPVSWSKCALCREDPERRLLPRERDELRAMTTGVTNYD